MIPKYVTKPKQHWSSSMDEEIVIPAVTVFESDEPVPTGLFDARGNELFRVPERGPLGFVSERKPRIRVKVKGVKK